MARTLHGKVKQRIYRDFKFKESAADKFWKLEERVRKDKKHPGVIIEMNKRDVIFNIFRLLDAEVIERDELEEFSEDLKDTVNFLMSRR